MADEDFTTPHGIIITGKWEWTSNADTGRWTNPQQGIKPKRVFAPTNEANPNNDGHEIRSSKLKMRGNGKSLVIRYESEDGKDFQLFGWAIPFTADTT